MRVALNPFYSQQNKVMGRFLLGSCGATKMLKFIAEKLRAQGHGVDFFAPDPAKVMTTDWADFSQWARRWGVELHLLNIPINNPEQRVHFDANKMAQVLRNDNLVINWHEFHAFPIRALFPRMKIIHYNGPFCDEPWAWMAPQFFVNWTAPDLLVGHNEGMLLHMYENLRERLGREYKGPRMSIWPMAFRAETVDEVDANPLVDGNRDIDLLFIQRSSVTNYTHHWEFLDALKILRSHGWNGKVATTDPTSYLRSEGGPAFYEKEYGLELIDPPKTDAEYARLLFRCRAMFLLNPNSDLAFREALYAGVCPIVGDLKAFRDVLGDWPYRVPVSDMVKPWSPGLIAGTIAQAIPHAGADPWPHGSHWKPALHTLGRAASFEGAWDAAISRDIAEVMK